MAAKSRSFSNQLFFINKALAKPSLATREDAKQKKLGWGESEVIGSVTIMEGEVLAIWRDRSVLESPHKIIGAYFNAETTQVCYGSKIREVSLFFDGKRIGYILAEDRDSCWCEMGSHQREHYILQVRLERAFKNRCLGSYLYIYMASMLKKKHHSILTSGNSPTNEALAVWKRLSLMGYSISQKEHCYDLCNFTINVLEL